MDILDILLDILLKPPQPFIGLFFELDQPTAWVYDILKISLVHFLWHFDGDMLLWLVQAKDAKVFFVSEKRLHVVNYYNNFWWKFHQNFLKANDEVMHEPYFHHYLYRGVES